ncbi:MAG: NAD(P)/FAD-dependent oxidoreductase [Chloroflexi bacterium]|nr:NAD(P)/FAD-dependent oxidoreductase [Chloroflexota bacterium]
MRVGVIGGGAAGLAAGYELTRHGHHAEVFERAPFLGGQASTFDVGGARLERAYHHLFTSDQDMMGLMGEVGLGSQLRWIESKVGIFCQDRIWPFVTPGDLLRFRPLSLVDRVRLGLVTLRLQRRREWRSLEGQTAAQWVLKHVGRGPYDVVLGPMLRGKFGEYHDQVSMVWLWNKFALRVTSRGKGLRGMQKERLGYPMCSFGAVFDEVGRRIVQAGGEVHTGASVERVVQEEGRATGLEVRLGDGEPQRREYDAIIATVPSYVFPRLVPGLPEGYLSRLRDVTYLAAVLVVLVLDRPLTSTYWLNIADRSIPFVGVIEHTNLVGPEHYGGKHVVYIANYLSRGHPLYQKGREELLEEYLPHLRRLNPEFQREWIQEYYYHREDAAQPVITTYYSRRIPDHRTPIPRLYLANTTQIYPEDRGTNYSVRLGRRVARMVLEDLG